MLIPHPTCTPHPFPRRPQDVFGGKTTFSYSAELRDGIVVIDPKEGTLECFGETEMTVTSASQELLARIRPGIVVVGPPEHGCYPVPDAVGHSVGRSVHRGVGVVHKTGRNGGWRWACAARIAAAARIALRRVAAPRGCCGFAG